MSQSSIIPAITSPLGKHWNQPSASSIEIDSKSATMNQSTFDKLADYSCSFPSGVYEGKMWKRKEKGVWYLLWYGYVDGISCSNNTRIIFKLEKEQAS